MPSLWSSVRSIARFAFTTQLTLPSLHRSLVHGGTPPSCPNAQISCQNSSAVANTCCFNAPGGQLLQTQFWDFDPATGPVDSWTIHGLWPDHCDGTYDQYCDQNRQYTNISAIISAAGANDLLAYMNKYWKDYQGNDESFWEHEWGKHGTCISTLEPSCYSNYVAQEEVVDYFQKAVDLYKTLPSYTWLSDAGIVPDSSKTYTSAAILAALKKVRGVDVTIQCKNTNQFDEIWYFYDVKGSTQSGEFIPTNPDGSKSSCPATGVKYLPKSSSSSPTTTKTTGTTKSTTTPTSAPPGTPFSGKGTLQVTTSSKSTGCIISGGTWYTTGTCATFTATSAGSGGGFTLTSSKGKCAVNSGTLTCAASVTTGTVFTGAGNGGALLAASAGGDGKWYADAVPQGSTQQTVYSTAGKSVELSISWASSTT